MRARPLLSARPEGVWGAVFWDFEGCFIGGLGCQIMTGDVLDAVRWAQAGSGWCSRWPAAG